MSFLKWAFYIILRSHLMVVVICEYIFSAYKVIFNLVLLQMPIKQEFTAIYFILEKMKYISAFSAHTFTNLRTSVLIFKHSRNLKNINDVSWLEQSKLSINTCSFTFLFNFCCIFWIRCAIKRREYKLTLKYLKNFETLRK